MSIIVDLQAIQQMVGVPTRYNVAVAPVKGNPAIEPDPIVIFEHMDVHGHQSFDYCRFEEVKYDLGPGSQMLVTM
jgi:hypothetical protein